METNKKEFEHIGNIIEKTLKSYRKKTDGELVRIWEIWDNTVGPAIFENARPAAFKGKLLIINVSSSTWIHALQFQKDIIIDKVNNALGKKLVKDIQFKVGVL
ncbi:DUF721 domain-containing protein [Desulfobacterales bacterium HSG17]|nr:DUF721 domain-containing protein [Desulfobacterales bacterium HSG17]